MLASCVYATDHDLKQRVATLEEKINLVTGNLSLSEMKERHQKLQEVREQRQSEREKIDKAQSMFAKLSFGCIGFSIVSLATYGAYQYIASKIGSS